MIHSQFEKELNLILPVSGSAAATYAPTFDVLGYDYATVIVQFASTGTSATDNPSVLLISEATTSNGSFTNVSGFVGDTDYTIPVSLTASSGMLVKLCVNTAYRQRYLKLSMTLGAAALISATARLSRAAQAPNTAAKQNVEALVIG